MMYHGSLEQARSAIARQGWIKEFHWYDSIDSTNSQAKRATNGNLQTPALFVAGEQTAGRGRSDHRWWSPTGCLMLTVAINQVNGPQQRDFRPLLALHVGIAVAQTAEIWLHPGKEHSTPVHLKWPNDVYVDGKKLAGILIESAPASATTPACWLIGIGMNVQNDWHNAPPEIRDRATCLSSISGVPVALDAVLVHLMEELTRQVEFWLCQSPQWLPEWTQRCLLTSKVVHARSGQTEIIGRCDGIDHRGRLLVRDAFTVHELQAAEVLSWQ